MGYFLRRRGAAADCNRSILSRGRKAMEGMMRSQREDPRLEKNVNRRRKMDGEGKKKRGHTNELTSGLRFISKNTYTSGASMV